jgi:hypothetical protein
MNSLSHQVVVVPADGKYCLGYHSPTDSTFYVIESFVSGALAQAASNLMNRARSLAQFDKEH